MAWRRRRFDDAQPQPFLEAARRGDLPAVQRYFELPDVRANVALWNAVHRAERLGEPRPWYDGTGRDEDVFTSEIVEGGQVELFQWFFAREQLAFFDESLRVVARDVLRTRILGEDYAASREVVDDIVHSALFQETLNDNERLEILGEMLNTAAAHGYHWWLGAILAYGADPNLSCHQETPLTASAYQGNSKTIDVLLAHGAWMKGDDLLTKRQFSRPTAVVRELLRRGADANVALGWFGSPLYQAAQYRYGEMVWLLIHEGVADVDARAAHARTPLMAILLDGHTFTRGMLSKLQVVELLLDGGASIGAVDDQGRGVLHCAVRDPVNTRNKCLAACLERGADPNLRDANGQTPLVTLLAGFWHDMFDPMAPTLILLLSAGADPFLSDRSGVSAAEMLARTETGRTFLHENETFFRR